MYSLHRWIRASLIGTVIAVGIGVETVDAEPRFRQHLINPESEFSACAAIDVNRDGKLDIFCGGFWYQAPDWQRHPTRSVPQIRGRYDDYSNLPLDVNGDGWQDIVSINYRSRSLFWVEHPGESLGMWKTHLIDSPGPSETGRLADIDDDGYLDLLPNGKDFAAWYRLNIGSNLETPTNDRLPSAEIRWTKHELPELLQGHGLGFGDIDGDGRKDLVSANGWAKAPENRFNDRWQSYPEFNTHRDASVPILVHDVDQDGDADVIWGRGHNIGLYWYEQVCHPERREWKFHVIDTSWSAAHSMLLADIDNDQRMDLVTAKRYLGHGGKDPAEYDPLGVYWYQFDVNTRSWKKHVASLGGTCGFDLDPKCIDLDGDGDIDILAPTRGGLHYLENLGSDMDAADAEVADPQIVEVTYPQSEPLLTFQDAQGEIRTVENGFDWGIRRWQIQKNLERVMGPLPDSSRRVPLEMRVEEEQEVDNYLRKKISYVAENGDRVPAFLLVPKAVEKNPGQKFPALLCLHPTSPLGKAQICGIDGKPSRFYAHELAKRGFICLAPDYPSFGDYTDYDFGSDLYVSGTMKAIWNNVRGVDLLESLTSVDRDKIGAIGHSLGGHNALFTAVFDQRIRAVVTSCGFNAFEDYYQGNLTGWTSDRYMPRIRTEFGKNPQRMPFDFDDILAAISPRPVFINAPLHDANFAVVGVEKSVASARSVYEFHEAGDKLVVVYPNAEHDFPEDIRWQCYDWLKQQLKP